MKMTGIRIKRLVIQDIKTQNEHLRLPGRQNKKYCRAPFGLRLSYPWRIRYHINNKVYVRTDMKTEWMGKYREMFEKAGAIPEKYVHAFSEILKDMGKSISEMEKSE